MDKLLIHGSSWTVGSYEKSDTHNSDRLVDGGVADFLGTQYDVTNISVQDNMNFGIWIGLVEHLKKNSYNKILICQNDPSLDFAIWRNPDTEWLKQFPYTKEELVDKNINTVTKLIDFLLNRFYESLGKMDIPVYIFGGPSVVNKQLAEQHGLHVIEPDWITALVGKNPTALESAYELDYMTQWLLNIFPENQAEIKLDFVEHATKLSDKLDLYKKNPNFFAYHHPTQVGNEIYYELLRLKL